jgi:acyl-coenzyme A thioesterase PaaI-like protein
MGNSLRRNWDRLSPLPGGKLLFSKVLGAVAPYSGSIDPRILELQPGYARISMSDRRAVRNHLQSIHAAAIVNLAELCGNLAVLYTLPEGDRMIVRGFSI